ncbi:ParB N-terminal domain-containing protein [Rhizobium metallidurans]|uniref:ParB family chromosome partitioning protein n=1 Tax=Rhizobium metallidurans TaxID=1265931 RepID=A0A7W6CP14_9HYPH|nr:ParB N-terminal domain-containing protein [Rhizobium metallidurans]MBB3963524.1 ParB family chromosome partitioning protein [Rhizobium metallidurans]
MLKSIPLTQILVGDRARPVDMEHAAAIAGSMVDRGLINPITVRSTPAAGGGATPYTLVAGGHRLEAARMNEWPEIEAVIVSADAAEAQLIEISENLFRNDLSALDRAVFVMKFREIFEDRHGKIDPKGGRPKKQAHDEPVIFSPGRELSQRVQERLGIAAATYKRISAIGQKLHPMLRAALRGTAYEHDQKQLLKLASMPEAEQTGIAKALQYEPDLKAILASDKPVVKKLPVDLQEAIFAKVCKLLDKADDDTLLRVLNHIGDKRDVSFLEAAE